MKVCAESGCPALCVGPRCTSHTRARDAARGRRQARGYDTDYDRLHRAYQQRMDSGETFQCWRCPQLGRQPHVVNPTPGAWHLGHDNRDRSVVHGPQCAWSNLHDAGRISPGT